MNDFAALSRMLENLIRFGVIAAVQMAPPRVQVKPEHWTPLGCHGSPCALELTKSGTRPPWVSK